MIWLKGHHQVIRCLKVNTLTFKIWALIFNFKKTTNPLPITNRLQSTPLTITPSSTKNPNSHRYTHQIPWNSYNHQMITYLNIIPKPLIEMKIRNAIDVLLNHNKPTRRVIRDRANFGKVMELFGNPYKDFRSIHITGTNGKGSVSLKIAKILELAGYKVGLYTSPHLFSFRERIKVNG